MTARDVLIWPDSNLLKISQAIGVIDDSVRELVADLIDTMNNKGHAAGLAAPQIGVLKRIFIVDIPPDQNDGNGTDGPEAFINPEIILNEGSFEWDEGCLSIPGERGTVRRHEKTRLRYTNIKGQICEVDSFGYLAGCFQHEIDHLNGKLWIDYQSPLKREMVRKKMMKLKRK